MTEQPNHDVVGCAEAPARPGRRTGLRGWPRWGPPLVSVGLVAWLVWRVSPGALARAAWQQDLRVLVPLTAAFVVVLYLWDALCLKWLFAQPKREVSYQTALRARGTSYLAGVLNYELGQTLLAWLMAKAQGVSILAALSRCVLLAYHDVGVLLALGLVGSLASADPRALAIRWFCGVGILVVGGIGTLPALMPRRWRDPPRKTRWGAWLGSWSWGRSAWLCLLRAAYFGIMVVYAAAALDLSGIRLDWGVVLRVIPLVLLADGLPVSVSGLGTRETALLYLLKADRPEAVLACSLIWSTGLIAGRTAIGLGNLWLSPGWAKHDVPQEEMP